jgi:hypothetical protein
MPRKQKTGGGTMPIHPVVLKLLCAALVGCLLLPVGGMLFPYVGIPLLPFTLLEAVLGATLGFGIAGWLGAS